MSTPTPDPATPTGSALAPRSSHTPNGAAPDPAVLDDGHTSTGRRRRGPIALGVLLVAAAAGAAAWYITDDDTAAEPAPTEVIQAISAEQRDLVEFTELDGTYGYPDPFAVGPRTDGTLTAVVAEGDRVERGEVLWAVDGQPTVLLHGDVPLHRPLDVGDIGDDVRLLEENLAALGHTVDGDLLVDDTYDTATALAVEAWQGDLGTDETGRVEPSAIHVEAGPVAVERVDARPGDLVRSGTPIVTAALVERTTIALATADGLVTDVVAVGDRLDTGTVLYEIDTVPVATIVGDPIGRELAEGVEDGADVETLEAALAALGHTADGDLEVDEIWGEATTEALLAWEEALGLPDDLVDGILQVDQVVVVPEAGTVATVDVDRGDEITRGTPIVTMLEPTEVVATEIAVADRDQLALGTEVLVRLPDGDEVVAIVSHVAGSSTVPPNQPDADPVLAVALTFAEPPASLAGFDELDVDVLVVDRLAEGVVAVPSSAIVSTGSAFAVEVVDGTTTRFVEVDPGMFADGWVEVTGIEVGTAVVVPS